MTKHDKAVIVDGLVCTFLHIKKLSFSGDIDRLCLDSISRLCNWADAENFKAELDEVRKRRIDPTS
jgi:hypothetical protein